MMGVTNRMKRLVSTAMAILLLFSAGVLPAEAAGSTAISLIPSATTIRIGDTVTITGNFSGQTVATFDLSIIYNTAQLRFVSAEGISPAIKAGELDAPDSGGSIHMIYLDGDGGLTGITTGGAFRLRFTVIGGAVGSAVTVSTQVTRIGDPDVNAMTASTNPAVMTLAAPLSGNTFLKSLAIDAGTLAPAFSKTVYAYSASVPFSVEKVNITATPEDATSKLTIASPALTPAAATEVSVTVTAQSGATKTYIISVTRAQDPNYKASSNADLKSLVPSQGILSPAFQPGTTAYVVYLPYEITRFSAAGEMEDAKAKGAAGEEIQLEVGENQFVMTGEAEDGTKKAYTITVHRMPEPGQSPTPEATPTTPADGFQITLSGILTDELGNPLPGMIVELHSDPKVTTTDSFGFYQFEDVTEGFHTIYVKDKDGIELAALPVVITEGTALQLQGNEIMVTGDTTLDLSLNDKLTIKSVTETGAVPTAEPKGVPIFAVILFAVVSILLGGIGSYLLFGDGRVLFIRRKRYEEEDEDDEGNYRIV
jgi:hypothetical protein